MSGNNLYCTYCGTMHHVSEHKECMKGVSNGTVPVEPVRALRFDDDKPDFTYLEPELREGIAAVMAYGAQKYERDNWKRSIATDKHDEYMQTILGCLLRHAYAVVDGKVLDEESGQHHMAHVATNAMMYLAYHERGQHYDL